MVVDKSPEWFVKIADFGISKRRHHDTSLLTMQRGTLGFAAPEVIGSTSDQSYTYSADMWSLGAMVYRILTSKMAFDSMGDLFKYTHGELEFPVNPLDSCSVSQRGQDFVLLLMESCPGSRGSAASARNHPWMMECLAPTDGEDWWVKIRNHDALTLIIASHWPEADNMVRAGHTDLSVPSKAWSSDEEGRSLPSHKVEASLKTWSSNRYLAVDPSQQTGYSLNAIAPETDSGINTDVMEGSDIHSEGPAGKGQIRTAPRQSIEEWLAEMASARELPRVYSTEEETDDEEDDTSSMAANSSTSRPENDQPKPKRAVSRL